MTSAHLTSDKIFLCIIRRKALSSRKSIWQVFLLIDHQSARDAQNIVSHSRGRVKRAKVKEMHEQKDSYKCDKRSEATQLSHNRHVCVRLCGTASSHWLQSYSWSIQLHKYISTGENHKKHFTCVFYFIFLFFNLPLSPARPRTLSSGEKRRAEQVTRIHPHKLFSRETFISSVQCISKRWKDHVNKLFGLRRFLVFLRRITVSRGDIFMIRRSTCNLLDLSNHIRFQ